MTSTSSQRPFSRVGLIVITIFVVAPIIFTGIAATSVNFAQGLWGGGFTLQWLQQGVEEIGPMLVRSLVVAVVVTVADLAIGGCLALWIARSTGIITSVVRQLLNLPMAVPGIALSIGLISLYPTLRRSGLLLVAGHILFTLPFALAALVPALADPRLIGCEQVAMTLGMKSSHILRTITAPVAITSSIQSMMMVFAISFGEFNVSFFINPPATSMAPFGLFDAYSTQRLEIGSAETVVFLAVLLPILGIFLLLRAALSSWKVSS